MKEEAQYNEQTRKHLKLEYRMKLTFASLAILLADCLGISFKSLTHQL